MNTSKTQSLSSVVVYFLYSTLLLLASCSYQSIPRVPEENQTALFSDADLDRAELDLARQRGQLLGRDEGTADEASVLAELPSFTIDISAQAVLPDAAGFVYYIEQDASNTAAPFKLFRHQQGSDTTLKIFEGLREIQSVAGSADGNTVVVSMRETTNATSDFEIFRLRINPVRTQRLTNNSAADRNISVSADGLKLVWEQPSSGIATLVLRTYNDRNTTTSFTENILTFSLAQRQPSLSGNGRFIALVRDLADGRDQVLRFNLATQSYLAIALSTSALEHPSVSNDGDKVLFLQQGTTGNDLARLRTISAATTQTVVNSPNLEHPFLTSDGKFIAFGLLQNSVFKVFCKDLATGQQLILTNPATPVNHLGVSWQMPFAGETKPALDSSVDAFENFGSTVAVAGNIMVVGSLDDYDADGDGTIETGAGSAYIYLRSAQGTWNLLKQLKPSDARALGQFGLAVAISGNTLVIGAGGANAAYIFQKDQGGLNNWGEVKKLVASDDTQTDRFGDSVAISGNTVVVGAPFESHDVDGNDTDDLLVGAAYIFFKDKGGTNNWGEVKKLVASDAQINPGQVGELFGNSVAISGTTVVVGAVFDLRDTDGNGTEEFDVGAAYLFQKDQGGVNTWGEVKKLVASDGSQADRFGQSLAIAGTTVVVGAPAERHDADGIAGDELAVGAGYIFEKDQGGTNTWGEVKKLVASDDTQSDKFGAEVAISGDVIAVGAEQKSVGQINPGAVYLFERNKGGTNTWGEVRQLLASDGEDFDRFGRAVAISGTTVVVGAPEDADNGEDAGSVYVFE